MDGAAIRARIADGLITIPAVWACMIVGGLAGVKLQPGVGGAAISIAVFVGLLFAWGHWTGSGRRTALPVYLLAALLYPVLAMTLLLSTPAGPTMGPLELLGVGMMVGYQPGGGPDSPGEFYLLPMIANLFGPILAMGLIRYWARPVETD